MAISTRLMLRLLSLLLLLLPPTFREHLSASYPSKDPGIGRELHPVVLVPGLCCSDIEARLTEAYSPSVPRCGAMKGKGWFSLWKNVSEMVANDNVECLLEQMRLVYDPAVNDYRNLPGVTRVPNFGSPTGFYPYVCYDNVREAMERLGYRDGDNLLGAPYDWRHAPPLPGQQSQVYSEYFQQVRALVETASKKHHKKVILFAHSYGGIVALEFVKNAPLAWRQRYIKHLFLVAPALTTGFLYQALFLTGGPSQMESAVHVTAQSMRPMWWSLETAIMDLPSPKVFGHEPIVVTRHKNYSAYDMEDLLAAIGFSEGVEPFRRRMVPKMDYFKAPMVPLTCINGVGTRTPRQLVFWEGNYNTPPDVVYGDGDGTINLISILAFDMEMRRQPGQNKQFKSVKIDKGEHAALIMDQWFVKLVMKEFFEANR